MRSRVHMTAVESHAHSSPNYQSRAPAHAASRRPRTMALHNRGLGCLVPLQLLAAAVAFTQPTLPRRAVLTLAPALALRTALHPAGAKLVTDPKGRFLLDLPDGFVQTKRTAVTGTLFVAGDFPRFAVVSVTAWRVDELLAAEQGQKSLPGLPAAPAASVQAPQALADLGSASAVAQILVRARDREAKAATSSELTSAAVSNTQGRHGRPLPAAWAAAWPRPAGRSPEPA
jgi:hypothetical protein